MPLGSGKKVIRELQGEAAPYHILVTRCFPASETQLWRASEWEIGKEQEEWKWKKNYCLARSSIRSEIGQLNVMNDARNGFEPASLPDTVAVQRDQPRFCEVWAYTESGNTP